MELTNSKYKYLINTLYIVSAIIFLSIAYNSFGYDDEYWNMRMIEDNSLTGLISKIQNFDVHPPLSYIVNFSFYKLFNNWTAVRLISSLLFILSLGYSLFRTKNNEAKLILLLLVGFNPSIMLWVTSIRWYAYAVPLLMILSHPLENNNKYYWYYLFLGFLLLSFISYVGIILIIPYFIWYFISNTIKEKYFTISIQSTHQGRYWNAKKGWNILLNLLKQRYGLTAVCIDMYNSYGSKDCYNTIPSGAIDKTGISLLESTHYMNHAEFHIGTSNGLSWLAHAVGKKVVLITNVTKKWCEFTTNVIRIDNESVCHGCLNEKPFDKYDWNWCPNHKNTKRMFECTTSISPHDVFDKIKNNITIK